MSAFICDGGKKLIKPRDKAEALFQDDPLGVFEPLKLVGETGFDLDMKIFERMKERAPEIRSTSPDSLREGLELIITGKHGAKAMRMAAASEVLHNIIPSCMPPRNKGEAEDLDVLLHELDVSRNQADLRIGLLFMCFDKERAAVDIKRLNFDEKTEINLLSLYKMDKLYFATAKYELKRFIYLNGFDVYNYLHDLSKQQMKVYSIPAFRVESRHYLLEEILKYKEPVFPDDMILSAKDLVEAGIVSEEGAEDLILKLIDVLHRYPGLNTEKKLLKKAKTLKRNPFAAMGRNIRWMR